MEYRWIYRETPDDTAIDHLSEEMGVNKTIAAILLQRGISSKQEADEYFDPPLNNLHNPFLMKDMDKAIKRMIRAMEQQESILIYGDYDVDGTTSVSLVYGFLKNYYDKIYYYIPDRDSEGYGLSKKGIDTAVQKQCTVLISLDCGIKATEMTDYANSKGIDVIISDHHLPGEILPDAYAILDPKLEDNKYPYQELSGCGVGFKILQAFCDKMAYDPDQLYDYLDLVAVSIAADIVPITDENRILSYHGLKKLNETPRPGLHALIQHADIPKGKVNISSIVFGIGPRINASGRMESADAAVDLLLADNYKDAEDLAKNLDSHNSKRRTTDIGITAEAIEMIRKDESLKNAKSTVLFKPDWHKGVIGIVASRCVDKYYRPTIILTQSNGKATGSARSVEGFDIYHAITECADLLDQYGGHMYAAGLTLEVDKVPEFRKRFEAIVAKQIREEQLTRLINIDAELDLNEIDWDFYKYLSKISPFGPGNPIPVFVSHNLHTYGSSRVLKNEHLKFYVHQKSEPGENTNSKVIEAIGWGMAENEPLINSGMPYSIAYYIEENTFRGNTTLQLRVKDILFD